MMSFTVGKIISILLLLLALFFKILKEFEKCVYGRLLENLGV